MISRSSSSRQETGGGEDRQVYAHVTGPAHEHYAHMRLALSAALAPTRPLVYAAKHEHSLQVFGPDAATQFEVVSGGGYYGHTTSVTFCERMLFARTASGFVRLEALNDGRVRLGVGTVDQAGNGTEAFSRWLK